MEKKKVMTMTTIYKYKCDSCVFEWYGDMNAIICPRCGKERSGVFSYEANNQKKLDCDFACESCAVNKTCYDPKNTVMFPNSRQTVCIRTVGGCDRCDERNICTDPKNEKIFKTFRHIKIDKGHVTAAIRYFTSTRRAHVAFAYCAPKEKHFSRKIGREISLGRLDKDIAFEMVMKEGVSFADQIFGYIFNQIPIDRLPNWIQKLKSSIDDKVAYVSKHL